MPWQPTPTYTPTEPSTVAELPPDFLAVRDLPAEEDDD